MWLLCCVFNLCTTQWNQTAIEASWEKHTQCRRALVHGSFNRITRRKHWTGILILLNVYGKSWNSHLGEGIHPSWGKSPNYQLRREQVSLGAPIRARLFPKHVLLNISVSFLMIFSFVILFKMSYIKNQPFVSCIKYSVENSGDSCHCSQSGDDWRLMEMKCAPGNPIISTLRPDHLHPPVTQFPFRLHIGYQIIR